MNSPERDELRLIWQQMSQHYNWTLVTDEDQFLDQVVAELRVLDEHQLMKARLRIAVKRTYSQLLHHGVYEREAQAVNELWQAILRLSIKGKWDHATATELAQETVARVLEKLPQLHSSKSFLFWAIRIWQTVQRDYLKQKASDLQFTSFLEREAQQVPDPVDMAVEIEKVLMNETIVNELRTVLSNDLECAVLMRLILFDDQPRDVAHDLGLPLHRTRVAKSRALKHLRNSKAFINLEIEANKLFAPVHSKVPSSRLIASFRLLCSAIKDVLSIQSVLGVAWGVDDTEIVLLDEQIADYQVTISVQKQTHENWGVLVTLVPGVTGQVTLTVSDNVFRAQLHPVAKTIVSDIPIALITTTDDLEVTVDIEVE